MPEPPTAHKFQSTLPRGERLLAMRLRPCNVKFQSTLPRGERQKRAAMSRRPRAFQSTLPRGERQDLRVLSIFFNGFNPRSRVGSDAFYRDALRQITVSIHAPAWGATHCCEFIGIIAFVSIHAPAWGATATHTMRCNCLQSFNPRSRVGSDAHSRASRINRACFNPRSRVGSDRLEQLPQEMRHLFQSTLPRGERQ